jgi:Nif-specific regulatory protein
MLCRRLLDLGRQRQLAPFLEEALHLIVEITGVQHGYLELYDESGEPQWSIASGFSEDELREVRQLISRGIISAAISSGETIVTASAREDLRFNKRESVRLGSIEAVLCAPIGDGPPRGVLYLQGSKHPGVFDEAERDLAEIFARQLGPLADRVLGEHRRGEETDATVPVRKQLHAEGIIGRSKALADVLRQAGLIAPLDVTVLLTGESGCGKSQLARVIHDNSSRASQPFIEVNCGALPETLLESELFGAVAGAHSTATSRIEGKVTAAGRGTLLLDEIGVLPLGAQAKLLQLLQSKEYYPLGAARPSRCEARVIAATNVDLERAVADRQFREDLFYRLQVLPIRVPSLNERRGPRTARFPFLSGGSAPVWSTAPTPSSAAAVMQTAVARQHQAAGARSGSRDRTAGGSAGTIGCICCRKSGCSRPLQRRPIRKPPVCSKGVAAPDARRNLLERYRYRRAARSHARMCGLIRLRMRRAGSEPIVIDAGALRSGAVA